MSTTQDRPSGAGRAARASRWRRLDTRTVRWAALGWLAVSAGGVLLAQGELPFPAPTFQDHSPLDRVLGANVALIEVFALMGVVALLTRHRRPVDWTSRAPERTLARRETALLLGYVVGALAVGFALARALGWHPFSLHLAGTVFGTHDRVEPAEALTWAGYNLLAYVVVPLAYFGRKYSATALDLRSSDRRNDLLVIATVLVLESWFQLMVLQPDLLDLGPGQLLKGVAVTFTLYLAGAVLPAMVIIYAVLVPRFQVLTGSTATTVVLGGLTYALLHVWDAWTVFSSPRAAALSICYLLLTYVGPGMIKTFLTVRTGNAWVHVWGYHALAPHTLLDTPHIVRVFGIR